MFFILKCFFYTYRYYASHFIFHRKGDWSERLPRPQYARPVPLSTAGLVSVHQPFGSLPSAKSQNLRRCTQPIPWFSTARPPPISAAQSPAPRNTVAYFIQPLSSEKNAKGGKIMDTYPDHAKRFQMLKQLQEVDFVLTELNLYLDTHPDDLSAIDQYNWYAKERDKLRRRYEKQFGPLMHFGHSFNQYPDGWNEGPWPWEI